MAAQDLAQSHPNRALGLMAGLVFIGLHDLMLFTKLDDPLDAVAVHMGGNLRRVQTIARKIF